jgi:membrane protein DedA with SNARE-associated domain
MIEFLVKYLALFAYPSVFTVLFLCGVALPLPEEPILISAGYMCFLGHANVWIMIVVALAGIIGGDMTIHWIGRRHGDWVFRSRLLRWVLPEDRLKKAEVFFGKHGAKAVFFGRFFAGIRFVVFFTAGKFDVKRRTFVFYDLLAALITVPISIWLPYYFGATLQKGLAYLQTYHRVAIGAVIGVLVLWIVGHQVANKIRDRLGRPRASAAPPPGAVPTATAPMPADATTPR